MNREGTREIASLRFCNGLKAWVKDRCSAVIVICLPLALGACGGGSSSQSNQLPPPPPSFSIVATPSTPSLAPGTSSDFQVSITPENGFSGAVAVSISGLPPGLTAAPSSFSLQNTPQSITLTAGSTLADGNYSFSLNGTSGTLNASATVKVGVQNLAGFLIIQPLIPQVVARFGATVEMQLETEQSGLGISNYLLTFSATGLPLGVSASFSPNPAPVGSTTTLSVTAPVNSSWIQGQVLNVVATPSAAVQPESMSLDLVVAPQPGGIPDNKSSYMRTDDTPQSIVYDAANQQIFSSNYFLNRVDVVSTASRQLIKSIPTLSPHGLALSIDGSEVFVGSDSQQVQAISTSSLQIVQQWLLPRHKGGTYGLYTLFPLSDGTIAFQPFLSALSGQLAIWNPVSNTTSVISLPSDIAESACIIAGAGTNIFVGTCSEPGVAYIYNKSTSRFSGPLNFPGLIYTVAPSPDGSQFIISDEIYGVGLYNSQLQAQTYFSPPDGYSSFIFSSDGSRIYLQEGVLAVFDGSGNFINTAPALGTIPPGAELGPCPDSETPFAVDSNGIIFGSADHGIAFDDSTYAVNFSSGFGGFTCLSLTLSPDSGPVDAITSTNFPIVEGFGSLPDVWFGSARAVQSSLGPGPAGSLSTVAPASSQSGPVDVKVILPSGNESYNPLVFSYGPSLMFVNGDTSTPAGGTTSYITGLGLPADPSQVQLTVGGQNATIASAVPAPFYGVEWPYSYPYPAVELKVTLPPGTGDQDVVVTTSAGSSTLSKAVHYLQSVTDYASPNGPFQSILLDRTRNQLYLSTGRNIDVFSLATFQFLTPFTPPALNGTANFHGMALTPDSSLLLAADFADGSVALINPDQPTTATAVEVIPPGNLFNLSTDNVVTTNTGLAFVEGLTTGSEGCGAPLLYELNIATLQVTTVNPPICQQPQGFPIAASIDGSEVLMSTTGNSGGQETAIYNAASNTWVENAGIDNFGGNAAVSANGTVFVGGSTLFDANADLLGLLAWQDVFQSPGPYPSLNLEAVPDGGSLVYIPYGNYTTFNVTYPGVVDIFDVNHGAHLRRINLSEQVQSVTNAMAIDAYGQNIYLITNAGLTIIKLANAPLAIGSVTPTSGSAGMTIVVSGSGFQTGAVVSANGTAAASTFVSANTLQAVVPNVAAGSVQITVTNPSGDTYALDNAFTAK
jgi:hypothetical protein